MNCFEARNDFPALWRKSLAEGRRAALIEHLGGCPRCDREFRAFALTAPVLYGGVEPDGRTSNRAQSAPRYGIRRERSILTRVISMCAGATAVAASVIAAYLAVAAPVGSFAAELSDSGAATDFVDDVAGGVNNDFAG
jgi:hypothetical protein